MFSSVDKEMLKIYDESFYISNAFHEIRSDETWSIYEIKLLMLILSVLSEHRVFIPKSDIVQDINSGYIEEKIKDVPQEYIFSKKEIQEKTGIPSKNFARDIKKVCKGMLKKIIDTPNPLDPKNPKSFKMFGWFTDSEYLDSKRQINITLHKDMIKRLVVFRQYTNLNFQIVFSINNCYALRVYLYCKILKSKYKIHENIKMDLDYFKNKIGLFDKYEKPSMFDKYVLKVIKKEINEKTDLNFDYELIKEGRKYIEIILKFYEAKTIENELDTKKNVQNQIKNDSVEKDSKNYLLDYLKEELIRYGIKAAKSEKLFKDYGCNTIDIAIEKMRAEIKKGKEIKNLAGYLIKCIENYSPIIDSSEITTEFEHQEIVAKQANDENERRWSEVEEFCSNNEKKIDILYQALKDNTALLHQDEIEFLNELKLFVEFYGEFNAHKRVIFDAFVDKGKTAIGFPILEAIAEHVKIAEPRERLPYIKKGILEKQDQLAKSKDHIKKETLESEIEEMNQLLFNLIE